MTFKKYPVIHVAITAIFIILLIGSSQATAGKKRHQTKSLGCVNGDSGLAPPWPRLVTSPRALPKSRPIRPCIPLPAICHPG